MLGSLSWLASPLRLFGIMLTTTSGTLSPPSAAVASGLDGSANLVQPLHRLHVERLEDREHLDVQLRELVLVQQEHGPLARLGLRRAEPHDVATRRVGHPQPLSFLDVALLAALDHDHRTPPQRVVFASGRRLLAPGGTGIPYLADDDRVRLLHAAPQRRQLVLPPDVSHLLLHLLERSRRLPADLLDGEPVAGDPADGEEDRPLALLRRRLEPDRHLRATRGAEVVGTAEHPLDAHDRRLLRRLDELHVRRARAQHLAGEHEPGAARQPLHLSRGHRAGPSTSQASRSHPRSMDAAADEGTMTWWSCRVKPRVPFRPENAVGRQR